MENGGAKELMCITHGYELGGVLVGGKYRMEGNKGEKKWDNCNGIVNKIYLKKEINTILLL